MLVKDCHEQRRAFAHADGRKLIEPAREAVTALVFRNGYAHGREDGGGDTPARADLERGYLLAEAVDGALHLLLRPRVLCAGSLLLRAGDEGVRGDDGVVLDADLLVMALGGVGAAW